VQVNSLYIADILTDAAFLFLQIQTTFVYVGDQGDSLGKVDMDCLVVRYLLVVFIRVGYRTVLNAGTAACTLVFENVTRFFSQFDGKITCSTSNTVNFGVGEDFDIWVPADLDQFR